MLIGIFGENCSGKSTLAAALAQRLGAQTVTGKDYLRMAGSEAEAERLFRERLRAAVAGERLIYVISEPEQLRLLPEGAIRVLVQADLETIKDRFRARMHGNLPAPVAQMLERKHGIFDGEPCRYRYDGAAGDPEALCSALLGSSKEATQSIS